MYEIVHACGIDIPLHAYKLWNLDDLNGSTSYLHVSSPLDILDKANDSLSTQSLVLAFILVQLQNVETCTCTLAVHKI